MRKIALSMALASIVTGHSAVAAQEIKICVANADPDDFASTFLKGPVVLPAGTVFDFAGEMMTGDLSDPLNSKGPLIDDDTSLTEAERARRQAIIEENFKIDRKHSRAVATTAQATLTKQRPCASVSGEALLSQKWGWQEAKIEASNTHYYQISGQLKRGYYESSPDASTRLGDLTAAGSINAEVVRSTTVVLDVDNWSATRPPDENPGQGAGNSECWDDPQRQDITCRALTEKFLLSLRGATKDEVVRAMKVAGLQTSEALHFLSNFSEGQRWGGGDVNFMFGPDGRVNVIFAILDAPDGTHAAFTWNAKELPGGCSDAPGSALPRC